MRKQLYSSGILFRGTLRSFVHDIARRSSFRVRPASLRPFRAQSTVNRPVRKTPSILFPERLLVYHAGTGRTVFVGCTKITTFFVFGFACVFVAPLYFNSPEEPEWSAPVVIAMGAVPLAYVARSTSPFVTYVNILLPRAARTSRESLLKWINSTGRDVELSVTTMNLIGLPRITPMRLAELVQRRERGGDISNLVRISKTPAENLVKRALFGKNARFHVSKTVNHAKEKKLWAALLERIPKSSQ